MSTLKASAVQYQYPGTRQGIPPTNLELDPGDFVHIKGASGSGKSTFARCLTGIIPHLYHGKLSGEIILSGKNTQQHPLWHLAEDAGMVFQNPAAQMLGNTVEEEIIFGLENLGLSKEEISRRLTYIIDTFSLNSFLQRAPHSLSGGEQQKIALAAIMARQPKVLVLDEPFSMLDVQAAAHLMEYLMKLSQLGTSIVAFEHRSEYFEDIPQIRKKLLNGHQRTTPIPHPNDRQLPVFSKSHNAEILQVKDLSVRLSGKTVVNRLNFELRGGTLTAIVGRNGSGKTTLLRALAGLQPHDGTVTIGSDRPNLGLVYQNADLQLFNPTVKEEILFRIPDPDMALYHSILEVLGLTIYQDTQPLLLSEGEKKRVALASVLMRQPEHGILLDEPSLGQDILHKEMLVQLSNALTRIGKIVVMTTHDLSLAAQADEIILLRESGIVAQGPTDQILKNDSSWDEVGLFVPEWVTNPQGWDHV